MPVTIVNRTQLITWTCTPQPPAGPHSLTLSFGIASCLPSLEQRQVIRCLLISPVFALTSWVGFRFVRHYIYFQLIRDMYEAFCIAAFCAL